MNPIATPANAAEARSPGGAQVYQTTVVWRGSTGVGYRRYDRTHRLALPPSPKTYALSSNPVFYGDPALPNPEQLLLAAASSCQLLSFLACAARAGVDVIAYHDEAEAIMPADSKPIRITRIVLRPKILLAAGSMADRAKRLVGQAHDRCFIANTLEADVRVEPVIETGSEAGV